MRLVGKLRGILSQVSPGRAAAPQRGRGPNAMQQEDSGERRPHLYYPFPTSFIYSPPPQINRSLHRCFSVWFLFYLLIYLCVHSIIYVGKLFTAKKQKIFETKEKYVYSLHTCNNAYGSFHSDKFCHTREQALSSVL